MWKRRTRGVAPTGDVTNTFVGKVRNLLQVGVINGGLHVHLPRSVGLTVMAGVMVSLLIAAAIYFLSEVPPQSRTAAQPVSLAPTTTSPTTAPASSSSSVPPVRPAEVRVVTVEVPGDKPAVVGDIQIAVETAGFTSTNNGGVDCGGAGNGPGGGGCIAIPGHSKGISTVGIIDFSVITPVLTCKTSSVHVDESVVIAEPPGSWARIVVLSIGPNTPTELPVTFQVSRGQSGPAPQSPKVCVPS